MMYNVSVLFLLQVIDSERIEHFKANAINPIILLGKKDKHPNNDEIGDISNYLEQIQNKEKYYRMEEIAWAVNQISFLLIKR